MSDPAIQRSAAIGSGMLPPALEADHGVIRQLPLFEGIPDGALIHAISRGGIALRSLERDMLVLDPIGLAAGQVAPVVHVARGQVAAAVFGEADLQERRAAQIAHENATAEEREEESLIKPAPLARIARKNVALFMAGDLFNSAALSATHGPPIAFYTTAPSALISLDHRWIAELAVRHPAFEQRLCRALSASRERLAWVSGVKQELLDFFVRQGISVAGQVVRVRQLDRCIDCKLCEEACEERYGARRLTLGGYQLGMIDFIYTCRTCTDPRCVDPCGYDAIRFDPDTREVAIHEAACTGCSACAQACPYGAIDMIEVEPDAPTFKQAFTARLEQHSALSFGPGTPRRARARRIASKCDHCMAYGDQACVSACPTGALIEVDPYGLFRERSLEMAQLARTGYDGDLTRGDRREVLPVMPFTEGLAVRSGGLARVRRGRHAPRVLWMIGICALLLALGEILLRKYAPEMSYRMMQVRANPDTMDLPLPAQLENVRFRAGEQLSIYCGLFGTALMIIAALYPVLRRIKLFRRMASNTMWFDFHLMAGTVGPMFVILHSALRLDTWVSAAFWSMVIVVMSGVLGRYLYTQVPGLSSGVELEELDHERAFQRARPRLTVAMAEIDRELAIQRARAQEVATSPSVVRALWWLIVHDIGRIPGTIARRGRLAQLGVERETRKELARRAARMIAIARRQVVAPKAQLLLHSWKKVHVPFTVILAGFAAVHIWVSWSRAW